MACMRAQCWRPHVPAFSCGGRPLHKSESRRSSFIREEYVLQNGIPALCWSQSSSYQWCKHPCVQNLFWLIIESEHRWWRQGDLLLIQPCSFNVRIVFVFWVVWHFPHLIIWLVFLNRSVPNLYFIGKLGIEDNTALYMIGYIYFDALPHYG